MVSTLDIFSRQHIGDSLFFSNKHLTFGDNLHEMSNSVLKYFSYFSQKTKTCFLGDNINLSSPAELAHRVKKVQVH